MRFGGVSLSKQAGVVATFTTARAAKSPRVGLRKLGTIRKALSCSEAGNFRPTFAYTGSVPVCIVSFTDTELASHSVEIEAHSLYEAAASALAEFRGSGMVTLIGPATRLQIIVRRPETVHELRVEKVETWLSSNAKSPSEQAVKARLREAMK